MSNVLNWFEICVSNLDRAARFYETMLDIEMKRDTPSPQPMAVFPYDQGTELGGALVVHEKREPHHDGTLVYLDATGKLDACLERAASAGGNVVLPKTDIGQYGFIALVRDTEGNCVGLHSPR